MSTEPEPQPIPAEAIAPPDGFAWVARATPRQGLMPAPIVGIEPILPQTIAEIIIAQGEIEQIPVINGLTFTVRPPKSKWQR